MKELRSSLLMVLVVAFGPWAAVAGTASLQGVGDLPGGQFLSWAFDVSADGSVVVGRSAIDSHYGLARFEAFRWQNGVMTGLGDLPGGSFDSEAWAVSADGSVVVGQSNENHAFRWENGVMSGLGAFAAYGVSADGSVVVGDPGFRWENGVMSGLGAFAPYGVSPDGSVVVGSGDSGNGREPFRWEDGVMTALGPLPGGSVPYLGAATAISADGSVIVGFTDSQESGTAWQAFRWENGVMTALGGFPRDYFLISHAWDVSADGSVVVGSSRTGGDGGRDTAFIWTAVTGMLDLRDVLTALGLDLTGWSWLIEAAGISHDGLTIVGYGGSPNGGEGWIATLPADWIEQVSYALTVTIAKSALAEWGTVAVEPNLPAYAVGRTVTLTALPNGDNAFKKWKLYDPNHPGDANHVVTDTNNPLTLVMMSDREVVAVFKCASGTPLLPALTLATLGLFVLIRRRA